LKLQITIDGKKYEAEVEILEDEPLPHQTSFGPYTPPPAAPLTMPAPALHAQTAGGEEHLDEHKVCRSPVTGIVISVNIGPGQAVQAGDLIVVLEAMKMETNLTAARAGKVKGINVAKGDAVKVGQVVVEFE